MDAIKTVVPAHPAEVRLLKSRQVVAIAWEDGSEHQLAATTLRRASRAAGEIRREADGVELRLPADLEVTGIEAIGNYAIRLSFSDGHDRAIYPFAYLRELAASMEASR